MEPTDKDWAEAIASRIADESPYDADDKAILEKALASALESAPEAMRTLIGTGIIEESYFDDELGISSWTEGASKPTP